MNSESDSFENDEKLNSFFDKNPDLQREFEEFLINYEASIAQLNNALYLSSINVAIPIRIINIMVDRMNDINQYRISKYGMYRDCEDYLVKTDWFNSLNSSQQFKIRFDFYSNIILGIHQAFYR